MSEDGEGFRAFVRSSLPILSRAAYALTFDIHRAQDLVQETHIRVARHWDRLAKPPSDPLPYARKILYRLWQDSLRWHSRHPERLGEVPDLAGDSTQEAVTEALVLREALARLPQLQRAVLVLRYLDGQTEAETAEILGCTVATVQSQARRGLSSLRGHYGLPVAEQQARRSSS